jgi:DNA-binding SARP family transcriptional activator
MNAARVEMRGTPGRDRPPTHTPSRWHLRLLDCWLLSKGNDEPSLGLREERMLAVLALFGSRMRGYVAGVLWPDSTDDHAMGNLRVAICRVEREAPGLLQHEGSRLGLSDDVRVDVHDFLSLTDRLIGPAAYTRADRKLTARAAHKLQRGDLLPGWYDDWVLYERSRLLQLRLRALEGLAERLTARGDTTAALSAAMAAVAIEPLRESGHRALINVHIADGNHHDAVREYQSFRTMLAAEMGVVPSGQLEALIRPLMCNRLPARAMDQHVTPASPPHAAHRYGVPVGARTRRRRSPPEDLWKPWSDSHRVIRHTPVGRVFCV